MIHLNHDESQNSGCLDKSKAVTGSNLCECDFCGNVQTIFLKFYMLL